jgi:hypothetical protein
MKACRCAGVDGDVMILSVPHPEFVVNCERWKSDILKLMKDRNMPLSGVSFVVREE